MPAQDIAQWPLYERYARVAFEPNPDFDPAPGYGSLGPGDYGVLHQADPPTTGTSHGLVYDRLNGTTTSPLYLDLSLFGALCADCNNNRIHDPCDLDCDAPGGRCAVPGCGSGDDCNYNRQPDDCDIAEGTSQDDNQNGVPDECDCVCGDADRSGGKIDLEDFAVFAFCYGLSAPSPDCSAADLYCCDLNGSGKVNLLDFAIFALLYGTTPSGLVPDCLE